MASVFIHEQFQYASKNGWQTLPPPTLVCGSVENTLASEAAPAVAKNMRRSTVLRRTPDNEEFDRWSMGCFIVPITPGGPATEPRLGQSLDAVRVFGTGDPAASPYHYCSSGAASPHKGTAPQSAMPKQLNGLTHRLGSGDTDIGQQPIVEARERMALLTPP